MSQILPPIWRLVACNAHLIEYADLSPIVFLWLQILFRTVDGYFVDNAIRTMSRSVGPHMVQAISMLDASTAEQRMRVSADDVVGPLEILYDFGVRLSWQRFLINIILIFAFFDGMNCRRWSPRELSMPARSPLCCLVPTRRS